MKLDHIMFAVANLDAGIDEVRQLTGVTAEFGGSHKGAGTRNALLSFGHEQYLEIIAPDPAQSLAGTMGEELSCLASSYVRTWAVVTQDYVPVISALDRSGFGHHIIDMSRTRPDGVHLAWQILLVTGQPHGLAMPFFINWMDSPHPALVAPGGCTLESFTVQCPDAGVYKTFCDDIGLEVNVRQGSLNLSAQIQAPAGSVVLA